MKSLKLTLLGSLVLLAACSSNTTVAQSPVLPPTESISDSWVDSRIEKLRDIAKKEGYQIKADGNRISVIVPVDGNFHPKRTLLLPSGLVPISKVAQALQGDTESRVFVNGYSTTDGDVLHNNKLSQERAQAIAAVMSLGGISRNRLHLNTSSDPHVQYNSAHPSSSGIDRRVEVVVTPYHMGNAYAKR